MIKKKSIRLCVVLFLFSLLISSCKKSPSSPIVDNTATSVESTPLSEPRKLTICLGYAPSSLFLYKASTQVEWDILQAIYDGPIDNIDSIPTPVILESIPSQANGGLEVSRVSINEGDNLLNASGEPVALGIGVSYLPSGCKSQDCAITWDGKTSILLDQTKISFRLNSEILWSDGSPLTAIDSVFSYSLASHSSIPNDKSIPDQISSYSSIDTTTVEVVLLPGLVPQDTAPYFFSPLPSHAWSAYSPEELLDADFSNKTPLGWGPYFIKEWNEEFILLEKNPYYFRASEGLPYFDELEFRFVSNQGDTNLASLEWDYSRYEILEYNWSPDGEMVYTDQCDIVDSTVDFSDQYDVLEYLLDYYMTPAVQVNLLPNGILEGLWLNPQRETTIDLQPALSLCLDRNYIDSKLTYSLAEQVNSIFQVEGTSTETNFSPEAAADILDSLGWLDEDSDLQTPRTSQGIASIEDGTPLVLSMIILNDPFYEKESELIQQSLWECGIQVDIRAYDAWDYYSDDGPLLQKDFDFILFSQSISHNFPCDILEQDWTEIVFPALNDLESLPSICEQIQSTNGDGEDKEALETALPLLPFFYHVDVSVTRVGICGFEPTTGTSSDLWNIEEIDYGDSCVNP